MEDGPDLALNMDEINYSMVVGQTNAKSYSWLASPASKGSFLGTEIPASPQSEVPSRFHFLHLMHYSKRSAYRTDCLPYHQSLVCFSSTQNPYIRGSVVLSLAKLNTADEAPEAALISA